MVGGVYISEEGGYELRSEEEFEAVLSGPSILELRLEPLGRALEIKGLP